MITQETHTIVGFCKQCDDRREIDPIDLLFDLKPSCKTCGVLLEEPFETVGRDAECLKKIEEE